MHYRCQALLYIGWLRTVRLVVILEFAENAKTLLRLKEWEMPSLMSISSAIGRRDLFRGVGFGAFALSFGGLSGCGEREPSINFVNWDSYIGVTTLSDFKDATGIRVDLSLISSNDEMFAKLRGGNRGYDVIVLSSDFVSRMVKADMLMPLDRDQITHFDNISPEFQEADYDPGRRFSMPYTWTVTGIGYRKSAVKEVPASWKWVFDSDRYKGRIALSSDSSELCRLGLKYLGYDLNTTQQSALAKVEQMLIRQKPNIVAFHDDNGQDLLLSGEVDLVVEYNGDIANVMREDPDLAFIVPNEGSLRSADCLCIPKGAPNPVLANRFINYILGAKPGAEIASTILYPTPNAAAKALLPASYANNPAIFPPEAILEKCQYPSYHSEDMQRAYERVITRVRAA